MSVIYIKRFKLISLNLFIFLYSPAESCLRDSNAKMCILKINQTGKSKFIDLGNEYYLFSVTIETCHFPGTRQRHSWVNFSQNSQNCWVITGKYIEHTVVSRCFYVNDDSTISHFKISIDLFFRGCTRNLLNVCLFYGAIRSSIPFEPLPNPDMCPFPIKAC